MESTPNTILIVEDDREISSMLTEFLSQNGFVINVATNGVEGLHMALSGSYSCILLDLMLPYKSGDELLKELRNVSETPVIVLSAKGLTQSKIDLLELGADDYMTKPFDLKELLARINANIRHVNVGRYSNMSICVGPITMDTVAKTVAIKKYNILNYQYAY